MRIYEVQQGDSPAKIAIQFAGCPKCAHDLVRANAHKPTVTYPNGFLTFQSLLPGERLYLPEKWFNGELDALPPSYFASLPYADGATPGKIALGEAPGSSQSPSQGLSTGAKIGIGVLASATVGGIAYAIRRRGRR